MYARRTHGTLAFALALVTLFNGCVGGPGGGQQPVPYVAVTYTLPILPIQIAYDFISQKISVSISGSIQTPLGTFGISTGVGFVEKKFSGVRTLIIEAGEKRYAYGLEKGRPYRISLPTDEDGKAEVTYPGNDENLIITIPHPTDETVAGLKEKLKEEQEARERAEAALKSQNEAQGAQQGQGTPQNLTPSPTVTPAQVLSGEQCKQLVAQYTPNQFLSVPPECQGMLEEYKRFLREQEAENERRRQQEMYERQRESEEERRRAEEAERRRQQQIQQWGNILNNVIRRRHRP